MRPPEAARGAHEALEIGARLGRPPSDAMVRTAFAAELDGQRALQRGMGLADLAHTVMLIEEGIAPLEPGSALLTALLTLHDGPELTLDPGLGDLYTNREAWLAARTTAVGWLGAGRARREATTIAWHLAVRDRLLRLNGALEACGRALTQRAAEMRDVLAPDYTYLQAGQPSTFGHYLLAFAFPITRDLDRLQSLFARVDQSPAGCGSANGSALPQDRHRLCALLGFPAPVVHARDAMWQADLPIECMAVAVAGIVNLDRLAEDLLFFCSSDVALVRLSDAHARASKILPQKRNPYALTHVRSVANRLIGVQAALAASGRTPSGQIDNRTLAYGEVVRALDDVTGAAWLMADVIEQLTVDAERAAGTLAEGFTAATDLSELFVRRAGLDYRTAQRLAGALARELADAGRPLSSLTPADVAAVSQRTLGVTVTVAPPVLANALDPRAAVQARNGPGGAAPDVVLAMVATCSAAFAAHAAWRDGLAAQKQTAEAELLECAWALARHAATVR
jgi:argininosuccinate lyase